MHCSRNLWVQKIKKYFNYQYSCCRETSCRGFNSNTRRTSLDQSLWCEKAIGCIKISGNPGLWLVNRRGRARWGRSKTSIVRFHKKLVKKEFYKDELQLTYHFCVWFRVNEVKKFLTFWSAYWNQCMINLTRHDLLFFKKQYRNWWLLNLVKKT